MTLKKVLRYLLRGILGFLVFLVLYIAAAFGLSAIPVDEEAGQPDEVTIFILTNGVHTDIVVPVQSEQMDWSERMPFSHIESTDTDFKYLALGWGDKGFYLETPTWAELKASVAFKAATGLSTTAIHATYYKEMEESESCRKIDISKDQYARLIDYVFDSLQTDANGEWMLIDTDANYSKTDAFYEATGRYNMFHTCNSWANKGLKASGQKHCLWTPFDRGIFAKYE